MSDVTPIIAALKKSGFPLQTRVEHEIQARTPGGWRVLACEYPWTDPDSEDQFIDLIAAYGCAVLVIECKKAHDRGLLFLRPVGAETTGLVKNLTLKHLEQRSTSGPSGILLRDDIELEPASYRAQFCVSTETGGRLLEKDARTVVLAADSVVERFPRSQLPNRSFVVPVIVTTSSLYALRFHPTEVSLTSGGFDNLAPDRIEPISWVRFHKALTTLPTGQPRTVLVVNSAALPNFLAEVSRGQG